MLNEIRAINCSLAKDFYKSLCKIIEERRTVYSPLLNFLKNPNKESDFDKDLNSTLIKSELMALILHYAMLLDLDNSISDEKNPTSIAKKLFDVIEECKSPIKSINRVAYLDTQLSKEIHLFISGGSRGEYSQAAYSYLGTISPTSVDCERCFSMATYDR